ncbi:MAG: hypothetical protein ACRD0M_06845, partial [Acidimicrobiales bacterium]
MFGWRARALAMLGDIAPVAAVSAAAAVAVALVVGPSTSGLLGPAEPPPPPPPLVSAPAGRG